MANYMTQWFFYYGAIAFSGATALMYLASTYAGRRLHAGRFWIGFPSRTNHLLRLGLFGELGEANRQLTWGFSLLVICVFGRKFDMAFIHYLIPLPYPDPDPQRDPEHDPQHDHDHEHDHDSLGNGVPPAPEENPMRDAWRLLMSVIHFIFTTTPAYFCIFCTLHQISYQ